MSEFLVVYDYGMGGVWGFARAQSQSELIAAFPELKTFHEKPQWMTSEEEAKIRSVSSFTVAEPHTYPEWLQVLIDQRDC